MIRSSTSAASSLPLNSPSIVSSFVIISFSSVTSIRHFLIFPTFLCRSSHCIHLFFALVWKASSWPLLWTPYHVDHLSLFHKAFLWGFILFFIWNTFPCLFILPHSLYLFLLGKAPSSHSLEKASLCRRWPLWPGSAIFPAHWSQLLREHPLCRLHVPASGWGCHSCSLAGSGCFTSCDTGCSAGGGECPSVLAG